MKEVIAERKSETLWLYLGIALVGLIALLIGCFAMDGMLFPLAIFGVIFLVVGGVCSWQVLKTPKIIIEYDGDNIILPDGAAYPVAELTKVNYTEAHSRGMTYKWGKLKLVLAGEEIEYNYVADVEEVHDRLMALRLDKEKTEG